MLESCFNYLIILKYSLKFRSEALKIWSKAWVGGCFLWVCLFEVQMNHFNWGDPYCQSLIFFSFAGRFPRENHHIFSLSLEEAYLLVLSGLSGNRQLEWGYLTIYCVHFHLILLLLCVIPILNFTSHPWNQNLSDQYLALEMVVHVAKLCGCKGDQGLLHLIAWVDAGVEGERVYSFASLRKTVKFGIISWFSLQYKTLNFAKFFMFCF